MGKGVSAINLRFGKRRSPYQELIPFTIGNTPIVIPPDTQIMPSRCGSHSEISGT